MMKLIQPNLALDLNLEDGLPSSLAGKCLIANPYGFFNDVFHKSVICLASHGKQGAIGLMVNNLVNNLPCKSLLKPLKDDNDIQDLMIQVHLGGPVDPERGFILHTTDYDKHSLFHLSNFLAISSNADILRDIANGTGPEQSIFVAGYTGWDAGQLEKEIESNLWLVAESSPDIIFSDNDNKWQLALQHLGINRNYFASQSGHG